MVIGLPPLINFGSDWMKNTVVPEILRGEKRICLAITEPTAGSDVANIRTSATLTPDGKYYIVNGVKVGRFYLFLKHVSHQQSTNHFTRARAYTRRNGLPMGTIHTISRRWFVLVVLEQEAFPSC